MHTSPNHRLLPPAPLRPTPFLRRPFLVDGRASADFLVFFPLRARARGSSARPGPFLPLRKKKKRRPAVKIINRKAYAVLSWLVRGCVRKRFDQGDPPSREEGRGCGVFSGSLKEESVKSQEFWRVARNIGQRASDKKKKEKKKRGWVRATICHGASSLCIRCVLASPRRPSVPRCAQSLVRYNYVEAVRRETKLFLLRSTILGENEIIGENDFCSRLIPASTMNSPIGRECVKENRFRAMFSLDAIVRLEYSRKIFVVSSRTVDRSHNFYPTRVGSHRRACAYYASL